MNDIKNLQLRWDEEFSSEINNRLTFADYANILFLAYQKAKIKDIAKQYSQTVAFLTELLGKTALKGRVIPASPFGNTVDGLADYRGFPLKEGLYRMEITDVDFSHSICEWAGSVRDCTVKNSRFVGVNLEGTFFGSAFVECALDQISLKNCRLGSSTFLDCTFIGTNLTSAMAGGARFTRCSFKRANMKKAIFLSCTFEECNFEETKFHNGSLVGCKFISGRPSDEQLGNTMV